MKLEFDVGDTVRCRNQNWEVIKIEAHGEDSWTVRLWSESGGAKPFLFPLTSIERVQSADNMLSIENMGPPDAYRLLTNAVRLSLVYEYDKLLSISNSKMVPEPFQLMAVKTVMDGLRQRFLIADDVGLGKTIEAGLVMQELAARGRGTRVLIVVPASLQDQWKKEMQRHFHRTFYIYNSRKIEGIQEAVDETLNPWLAKNSVVTSIDWIKPHWEGQGNARRNLNRAYDQLMVVERPWDLVILDEAHYASTDSNRSDLGRALADRCEALLLLTATPHSGNPEHFWNLLRLIDPFLFASADELDRIGALARVERVMIRRGKESVFEINPAGELVPKFPPREPHPVAVHFSAPERALYDAVSDYTGGHWAQLARKRTISASERNIGRFLLALVQKRMVSSPFALRETLARRIESIIDARTVTKIGFPSDRELRRLLRDYDGGDSQDYMEDDDRERVERFLETRNVQAMYANRTNEIKTLRELLALADGIIDGGQDSKLRWLLDFVRACLKENEKVIIFTEYRDTLNYIRRALEKEWWVTSAQIVQLHGGMGLGEDENDEGSKLWAERRFNDPDTRILLATDAASEGLNLQKHCHILVNYELPWNPNRLEQRIGRIHRYGQKHTAQIYNLMIEDSKEADIFNLLAAKIEIIRRQLGSMAEVLGVLEKVSLDQLILGALDKTRSAQAVTQEAERELQKIEAMATALRDTRFISGPREFGRAQNEEAREVVAASEKVLPDHKDVKSFVETFLRLYGDAGSGALDGRKLGNTNTAGIFRLPVPLVLQDDKMPRFYPRATFERTLAMNAPDGEVWNRADEPEFVAFGHPLIGRMVRYCRVTQFAQLSGQTTCLALDYSGGPGILWNFLLSFEDQQGRVVREELEPVWVGLDGEIAPSRGQKFYLQAARSGEISPEMRTQLSDALPALRDKAEAWAREHYQRGYANVGASREEEVCFLLEDLQRFDRGIREQFDRRRHSGEDGSHQLDLFDDSTMRAFRTRLENEEKLHAHRADERRLSIEKMRLGAHLAPQLLNFALTVPIA